MTRARPSSRQVRLEVRSIGAGARRTRARTTRSRTATGPTSNPLARDARRVLGRTRRRRSAARRRMHHRSRPRQKSPRQPSRDTGGSRATCRRLDAHGRRPGGDEEARWHASPSAHAAARWASSAGRRSRSMAAAASWRGGARGSSKSCTPVTTTTRCSTNGTAANGSRSPAARPRISCTSRPGAAKEEIPWRRSRR
jgi:hypothetical protein